MEGVSSPNQLEGKGQELTPLENISNLPDQGSSGQQIHPGTGSDGTSLAPPQENTSLAQPEENNSLALLQENNSILTVDVLNAIVKGARPTR